jgi:hypothetical protein
MGGAIVRPLRTGNRAKPPCAPQNAMVTRDYRLDRVRIFVNPDQTVAKTPRQG